jgi:hypothetical protein
MTAKSRKSGIDQEQLAYCVKAHFSLSVEDTTSLRFFALKSSLMCAPCTMGVAS